MMIFIEMHKLTKTKNLEISEFINGVIADMEFGKSGYDAETSEYWSGDFKFSFKSISQGDRKFFNVNTNDDDTIYKQRLKEIYEKD